MFAPASADAVTVTWCAVPGFDSQTNLVTVQASLLPDGHVEMTFDRDITFRRVIVGLSPVRTATLEAVDLTDTGPTPGGAGAIGERFSARAEIDLVAAAAKFAASYPDAYDQLVIWTDRPSLLEDAFAYEIGVANDIRGIGLPINDSSAALGTDELSSIVVMGNCDPQIDYQARMAIKNKARWLNMLRKANLLQDVVGRKAAEQRSGAATGGRAGSLSGTAPEPLPARAAAVVACTEQSASEGASTRTETADRRLHGPEHTTQPTRRTERRVE